MSTHERERTGGNGLPRTRYCLERSMLNYTLVRFGVNINESIQKYVNGSSNLAAMVVSVEPEADLSEVYDMAHRPEILAVGRRTPHSVIGSGSNEMSWVETGSEKARFPVAYVLVLLDDSKK